jgi:ElaB/YqjD/DUF883 family membrane-anchored ribosome-binding protein
MHRNSHRNQTKDSTGAIAEHAHALLEATKDVADEKITVVRDRLNSALAAARETYEDVEEAAVNKAKAADKYIRANPYQSVAMAFGLGALLSYIFSHRRRD